MGYLQKPVFFVFGNHDWPPKPTITLNLESMPLFVVPATGFVSVQVQIMGIFV